MTTTSKVTINISSEHADQLIAALQSMGVGDVSVQPVVPSFQQADQLIAALQSMGVGDVSVQPVVPSFQQAEQDNQNQCDLAPLPTYDDLGVISMDDEDDAEQCEVSAVIDHTRPMPADGIDNWMFKVKFKDGTSEWVRDDDCHCDKLISEYLKHAGIRTIYCFCRVSSKAQAGPGHVSLDVQEDKITSWATLLETDKGVPKVHQIYQGNSYRVKVVKAIQSAHTRIPTELKRIGELANPFDKILVYKIDRLSRHMHGFVEWLDDLYTRGVTVSSLSENIDYKGKNDTVFLQHLLDATKESVNIGERVRLSIEHRRTKGQFVGGLPYGKKRVMVSPGDYKIEDNVSERAIIDRIVSSWPAVYDKNLAEQLNNEGVTKKGRTWTTSMVGYIRDKNGRCPKPLRETSTRPRHTRLQMVMEVVDKNSQPRFLDAFERTERSRVGPGEYVSRSNIRTQLNDAMPNTVLNRILKDAVFKGLLIKHRDSFKIATK